MSALLFPLLFLCHAMNNHSNSIPDYKPGTLYMMIDKSELIVNSSIIAQDDTTVTLDIKEVMKGKLKSKNLVIRKYVDWPCSRRYDQYKIGQEQIFLLIRRNHPLYENFSIGNESELVIVADTLYYKSWGAKESPYYGWLGRLDGYRFDASESKEALKRMIELTEQYPAINTDCSFIIYKPQNAFERFVLEEHALSNMRSHCPEVEKMKFHVIPYKWIGK